MEEYLDNRSKGNVLAFGIGGTALASLVTAPAFVRDNDLVRRLTETEPLVNGSVTNLIVSPRST